MSDWTPEDEIEGDLDPLAEYPTLLAVRRFAKLARRIRWFARLGQPLTEDDRERIDSFLFAVGFEGLDTALITEWEDADIAAGVPDVDTLWGETQDQLMVTVQAQSLELVDEDYLRIALAHLGEQVSQPIIDAAYRAASEAAYVDETLINAAVGAATQSAYTAALAIAGDAGLDHPFAQRFRLFEAGRWPVALAGNTLHLF